MNTVYLLTGGNVGNRQQYLQHAARLIEDSCGKIRRYSAIYETAPWGKTDQGAFLNQALELATLLSPGSLMQQLLHIEKAIGRTRQELYGPRTIDLDILLFNEEILHTPLVTIPHPQMHLRRFVLAPLCEIAPALIHPVFNTPVAQLLQECPDELPVKKFSAG